jgi:hypothetical protein
MDVLERLIPSQAKQLIMNRLERIFFEIRLRRATPDFIYQMGKVGSSSVYHSILQQYSGAVFHAHNFFIDHEDPPIRHLYDWVIVKERPLKVISLTREPIGRNVSAFFQNFDRDTGVPYAKSAFSIEELKAIFLLNYKHEIPLVWFDNNIRVNFGIDVFATQFSESGIATYANNNIELLIMRLEVADDEKNKAIGSFLGLDHFQLQRTNVGEEKEYSTTYNEFKRKVRFSSDYIDKMCNSKYFNHFYSQETINAVRTKWSKGS